jgi:uncharacterized RmlC-like cupin family protein
MNKSRPVVVHPEEAIAGPTTPGLELRHHVDPDGRWLGWSGWIRNAAGDVSGWHHHAANDTYVHVIRGSVTIEFGPDGAEHVEARAGDFLLVPSQTIHRELTGPDADLEAFVLRVGGEPEHVNVDGPDGAGR